MACGVDSRALALPPRSTSSASRPFLAAQNEVATTATPDGTWTTSLDAAHRPRARVAFMLLTVAPNTGGRATSAVSMPGTLASRPNVASPVTFSRLSSRRVGLPMILNCDGSFSGDVRRHRHRAAACSTSCP